MFACAPDTVYLYSQSHGAARLAIRCPRLTIEDPLLTADTWNPEIEAAAQAASATITLTGVDTAAIMALPWTIDRLAFNYRGTSLSFQLAYSIQFAGPRSICLRTRGERHYATRREMACLL
ncbi:hypothetical protein OR16_36207 [Cupriavidus basilensis OR16]|uniref:Uncharacterized protein n=1 Tax=Cupriavidus basilensis OR16 TaxID=1127483 RepID=H1SFV5_9BURK|nr:hypothetical protein [Cupriavidus basilensis]EHP38677.1 hypothetical protein OR16_36207 [Cupriavidus basilensis OR16]